MGAQRGRRHVPFLRRRGHQAGPGRRRELTHRIPQAAHRGRATGRLGRAEILPRIRQRHIHIGQAGIQLLGHDHRQRGGDALTDLGPWHLEPDPVVRADLQHEQVGIGPGQRRHHIAEIRDVRRLRRARHHRVSPRRRQDLRADARGNRQRRRRDQKREKAASSQSPRCVPIGQLACIRREFRHRISSTEQARVARGDLRMAHLASAKRCSGVTAHSGDMPPAQARRR